MRLAFPAPLLAAAAALVFLFVEDNPIWGGTIASTLAGEFSYTYGVGFARAVPRRAGAGAMPTGGGPWLPAAALALTSYAHGYAVLWAGLSATGLLLADPAGRRAADGGADRARGASSRARACGSCSGWRPSRSSRSRSPRLRCVPLLADWGWTTPYDDAWIELNAEPRLPAAAPAAVRCRWPRARSGAREPPRARPSPRRPSAAARVRRARAAPRSPRPARDSA